MTRQSNIAINHVEISSSSIIPFAAPPSPSNVLLMIMMMAAKKGSRKEEQERIRGAGEYSEGSIILFLARL
jgi:hypothetical protein